MSAALAKSVIYLKVVDSQEKPHIVSFREWRPSCTYESFVSLKLIHKKSHTQFPMASEVFAAHVKSFVSLKVVDSQEKSHTTCLASEAFAALAISFVSLKVVYSQEKSHTISFVEWRACYTCEILCFTKVDYQEKSHTISFGEWRVCCTCKILPFL